MALDGDLQTNIIKKTPGLTNLFHSNVRRSRSLASLQKMAPDTQSLAPMPANSEQYGLPKRPQLKPAKTAVMADDLKQSGGKKWIITPISSSPTVPNLSRTPSPPSRPAPAPRLWTEDDEDIKPSLVGLESAVAPGSLPRQRSPFATNPPMTNNSSPSTITATPNKYGSSPRPSQANSPRAGSPANTTPKQVIRPRKESLSQRRNNSVAELVLDPLKTVPEVKTPQSALPKASEGTKSSPQRPNPEKNERTPRPSDIQAKKNAASSSSDYNMITPTPPDMRRASSMLLPMSLAPLVIPGLHSPPETLPPTTYNIKSPEEQKPPVPPKSPRTLFRAVPSQKTPKTPGRKPGRSSPSHTASSSISSSTASVSTTPSRNDTSSTTASTAATQNSPVELPVPWIPWASPKELESPESQQESSSAPAMTTSPMPWSMKERSDSASEHLAAHTRANASIDTTYTSVSMVSASSGAAGHSRNYSESSVLNRGRPMKRSETSLKRVASRGVKLVEELENRLEEDLPEGYSKGRAISILSREELLSLRHTAETQAADFQALPERDVSELTRELSLLDEHSGELRLKAVSLREERQNLHRRLISYLKAPGNALVSREHVVKQDSALAELDETIDEATTKLEAVQERRVVVQRKLLEHVGAVLAIRVPSVSDEQTPPRSPVANESTDGDALKMRGQLEQLQFEQQIEQEAAELDTMTAAQQERQEREREQELELERDRAQAQAKAQEQAERQQHWEQEKKQQQQELAAQQQKQQRQQEAAAAVQKVVSQQFLQPVSMDKTMSMQLSRGDVESIRIYADTGVASLLASIEQEIDAMDRLRRA